ncbi:MAG: hypothetical protein JWP61_101 [Friedmanniella sp.]|nr:hypothetical protein [Friedmanniella sp.]
MVLTLAALLVGCAYSPTEPGLFGRPPRPTATARAPQLVGPTPVAVRDTDADLPVVGEALWTSGDGQDVTFRIAVHAVRRVEGGTVLDWSLTPVAAPGLATGAALVRPVDLGLTGPAGESGSLGLLDTDQGRLYRPLRTRARTDACLCTSLARAGEGLRIGATVLHQVAFPTLPAGLRSVDVDIATVPVFNNVPVTPAGAVPVVTTPVSLAAPPEEQEPLGVTQMLDPAPNQQQFLISLDAVAASPTLTSVQWTIRSITAGPGLDEQPRAPITEADPPPQDTNPAAASGPQLRVSGAGGAPLRALRVTDRRTGRSGWQCLCTDLRGWAPALQLAQHEVQVVTVFAALPRGATSVDVAFPGTPVFTRIHTSAAPDAAFRAAGPEPAPVRTWPRGEAPTGWLPQEWPTPVPRAGDLRAALVTVDEVVTAG